jgi:hypothetical protein
MIAYDGLNRILEDMVMTDLTVLSQHSFEGTKESHMCLYRTSLVMPDFNTVSYFKWACFVMKYICISVAVHDPLIKSTVLWTNVFLIMRTFPGEQ